MKETKSERFRRVAEARVNKIIRMLRLLGNCAATSVYAYDDSAVEQIFSTLQIELDKARVRYTAEGGRSKKHFSLSENYAPDTISHPHSHIGKVENGKVGVSIELLVSIANELQTTVDQLLQDSYDYKEQVIIRDIYKRIGNLPIKTKITACEMLQYLIDIIEKAHD